MFTENVANSRYFGIDEIQALKLHDKIKSVFLPDKCTCKSFEIIPVCENRISKKTSLTCNINLSNNSFESTPAESAAGGTRLYIYNCLSYKPLLTLTLTRSLK